MQMEEKTTLELTGYKKELLEEYKKLHRILHQEEELDDETYIMFALSRAIRDTKELLKLLGKEEETNGK